MFIHGLWPIDFDGDVLEEVEQDYTNMTEVENSINSDMYLRYEMDTYWQSLNIPNNLRFWFHEWNTHGRCQTTLTALNYFKRTVQLALTTDLLSTLKAYGIIPDGSLYRRSDFEDAIYDITRKIPQFSCDRNGVLTEEIICVDKHAENFIPCQNYQGKCNADPIGLVN
ncbi:hypothetical protein ACOSP7_013629 [Xanthoceras sorbifolium]